MNPSVSPNNKLAAKRKDKKLEKAQVKRRASGKVSKSQDPGSRSEIKDENDLINAIKP